MRFSYAIVLVALVACGTSKPAYEGVCIVAGEDGTPDSCWLDNKTKANCEGTFIEQPSRDKGEIYCTMEGFKGDPKNGVLHRKQPMK